jgi:hypothetical protein
VATLPVVYLVFAQSADGTLPLAALCRNAETHFGSTVTLTEETPGAGFQSAYRVALEFREPPGHGTFVVHVRASSPADVAAATEAERRGSAAGMSTLAARCRFSWIVEPESATPDWAVWECCALLALTALGPILPPDHSTLLGVRSARERAVRAR